MNKLLTKIAKALLGLSMAVGVGVAIKSNGSVSFSVNADTVVDTLNQSWTGITNNTYTSFSNKKVTSDAIYAGNCAGSNSSIQLRSKNSNSGIVTTTSGGLAKSVEVVWNSNTANGRTLNVYGKGEAYSAATDLYSTSTQGTLIGTIVKGTSTKLTIEDDYEYIGFRSNSDAMYLTSVTITWEIGGEDTPSQLKKPDGFSYNSSSQKVTWSTVTDASGYKYNFDNGDVWTETSVCEADVSGRDDGTNTIYVKAIDNSNNHPESAISSFVFTKITPTTISNVSISGAPIGDVTNATIGETKTLTASATNATGSAQSSFTWSSTNENVATVSSGGVITYLGNGTTTINVQSNYPASGSGTNSASVSITVSNIKGTLSNPLTPDEAIAIMDVTGTSVVYPYEVHVLGTFESGTVYNSTYGRYEGSFGASNNKAVVVKATNNSGEPIGTNNGDADGKVVIVKGYLEYYSSKYQIPYLNTSYSPTGVAYTPSIVSVIKPVISALSVNTTDATTEFEIESEFSSDGIVVTGTVDGVSGIGIPSTDYSVSTPDMNQSGQQTITIEYTGSEYSYESTISTSYDINVVVPSANPTIQLINEIGNVSYDSACKEKIDAARSSYNALPQASKNTITEQQLKVLTDAEDAFDSLVLEAVEAVEELIDAIGTVSLSSEAAIEAAEAAYDALLDGEVGKNLVSNYSLLTTARTDYDNLVDDQEAVQETIELIGLIGEVVYEQACYDKIFAAQTAFNNLSDASKTYVSNHSVLEDALSDFDELAYNAATQVEELIDAIGTVSLSSEAAIEAAEAAYDALLDGDYGKSLVNSAKYVTLTTARSTYNLMVSDKAVADSVTASINSLPNPSDISDYTHHDDIVAARTAYNSLTDGQKDFISESTLAKLVACEEADSEYAPLFIEIQHNYTGNNQTNMDGSNEAYSRFGLDQTIWSIVGTKNTPTNNIGINKDKTLRLYSDRASGEGNTLTVSVLDASYKILTMSFEIGSSSGGSVTYAVKAGDTVITANNGEYAINGNVFSITNTYHDTSASSNQQLHITKITVYYEITVSATAADFLNAVNSIPEVSNITSSNINEVNELIVSADNEYNKLTSELLSDSEVIAAKAILDAAKEKAIDVGYEIEAADTIAAIEALPAASSINDYSHHSDILAARALYDELSEGAKAKVGNEKLQKLVACEAADLENKPISIDIDTDGGQEHSGDSNAPTTAFSNAASLEEAYSTGSDLLSWSGLSVAYGSTDSVLKLGSSKSRGYVKLSFNHNRAYATAVTLDVKAWSDKSVTASVNGVTQEFTGVNHALTFSLLSDPNWEFTSDITITTSAGDNRISIYGISIEYDYREDYKEAENFENSFIKRGIDYPETTPTGYAGQDCLAENKGGQGYFDEAYEYYTSSSMSSAARLEFATHEDFASARERFQAWARANGKTIEFNTETGAISVNQANSLLLNVLNNKNVNSIALITIISMVSVSAIGGYFFLRKRKEQ